jgi:hypothetical protein
MTRLWWSVVAFSLVVSGCEDKAWERFKVDHKCKVVGRTAETSGFTSKGDIVFIDGTTTWLCDDGVRYTR